LSLPSQGGVLAIPQSAPLRAEEAIKNALDVVQMVLVDVPADVQAVAKHRFTGAHHTELLGQIRQVLRSGRLPRSLRHADRPAGAAAKDVTQDLAEDVAAGDLRTGRSRLSSGDWYLDAPPTARDWNLSRSASDDHGLYPPLLYALL
jgi:hypothetical protein